MSRTKTNSRLDRELTKRRNIEYEIHHKKRALQAANRRIERIKGESEIVVSNHALLRFAERVLKIDFEEIKKSILSDQVLRLYKELGNGKYPNGTYHVVIENNCVKTIM
jgi:hypothetical protein